MKKLTENEHTRIFSNRHILSYGKTRSSYPQGFVRGTSTFLSLLVVGLGFGLMSGAFSLVNVLADSLGPGTVGFNGEPQNFFMISAALCLCMVLCHTCWGVITFAALDEGKFAMVGFVWGCHMLISCLVSISCSRQAIFSYLLYFRFCLIIRFVFEDECLG